MKMDRILKISGLIAALCLWGGQPLRADKDEHAEHEHSKKEVKSEESEHREEDHVDGKEEKKDSCCDEDDDDDAKGGSNAKIEKELKKLRKAVKKLHRKGEKGEPKHGAAHVREDVLIPGPGRRQMNVQIFRRDFGEPGEGQPHVRPFAPGRGGPMGGPGFGPRSGPAFGGGMGGAGMQPMMPGMQPHAGMPGMPQSLSDEQAQHLQEAINHLRSAGLNQPAEHMQQLLNNFQHEKGTNRGNGRNEEMERQLQNLRQRVEHLQDETNRLRRENDELKSRGEHR